MSATEPRRRRMRGVARAAALLALAVGAAPGARAQTVWLQTARPAGSAVNDRIPVDFRVARGAAAPAPAVVVLHPLGAHGGLMVDLVARYLADRGIASAVIDLPWHLRRRPAGVDSVRRFISTDVRASVASLDQAASDVSTVVTWLQARPDVDARRIGVVGISLGAIVTHLAMGRDARITAGAAIVGGADLPELYERSALFGLYLPQREPGLWRAHADLVRTVDPLTYAGANRPRRVLMVQAARDMLVPPSGASKLWEALGRPPIVWLDTNHYGPVLGGWWLLRGIARFLQDAWSGREPLRAPFVWVPTIKAGLVIGLGATASPAITWQVLALGRRPDRVSLVHANLGWSTRGPFVGAALTVTPYLDVGAAHRFDGRLLRPYAALHVVF